MGASNAKHAGQAATLVVRRCSTSTGVEAPRGCLQGCTPAPSRSSVATAFRKAPASTDDSPCDGGVFSPSRTHPTVARLISDLKGEAPHGTRAPLSVRLHNALLRSCVSPLSTYADFHLRCFSSSAYWSLSFALLRARPRQLLRLQTLHLRLRCRLCLLRRLFCRLFLLLRLRLLHFCPDISTLLLSRP